MKTNRIKQFFCKHKMVEKFIYNNPYNFINIYKHKELKCSKCKKIKIDSKKIELNDLEMKEYLQSFIFMKTIEIESLKNLIEIAKQLIEKQKNKD